MALRNAVLLTKHAESQTVHLLRSISTQSLNNDTVKTGTEFWRHFFHEHVKSSYLQQEQIKAISPKSKWVSICKTEPECGSK